MQVQADEASATENNDSDTVFCKVCGALFTDLQKCLKHELLQHLNTEKHVRHRFNAIRKLFNKDEREKERQELKAVLEQAPAGQELAALLCHYTGNGDKRIECFLHVRDCIETELRCKVKVFAFGSMVTGLALNDSDIDLFLLTENKIPSHIAHSKVFNIVNNYLRHSEHFTDVCAIRHARVPIIRCKHQLTGCSLDINMSHPNSIYNSHFVADLVRLDMRLLELFVFLKIWAKKMKIISQSNMTSYCFITLIIYYLQRKGLLPTIKELQSPCMPKIIGAINYAYNLSITRPLPEDLTTLNLIRGFFEYYKNMEFENIILVPYLGQALQIKDMFAVPSCFPEYHLQMRAVWDATKTQPLPFQSHRSVCVQDPFELHHNVAKSISQTNLLYLRQCFVLAAHACKNQQLLDNPMKLFCYLLFGLTDNVLAKSAVVQARPAKQSKQRTNITKMIVIMRDNESPNATAKESKEDEPKAVTETNSETYSPTPMKHVHILTPTSADLKALRAYFLINNQDTTKTIFYHWLHNYVDAIKDILKQIYGLNLKPTMQQKQDTKSECDNTWLISTTLDTWTSRKFQKHKNCGFFNYQMRQTAQFEKHRPGNEEYEVNLRGLLSLQASDDFKELRIELETMPDDIRGVQRNSPLTKFFKSLKNILNTFNLREKIKK